MTHPAFICRGAISLGVEMIVGIRSRAREKIRDLRWDEMRGYEVRGEERWFEVRSDDMERRREWIRERILQNEKSRKE